MRYEINIDGTVTEHEDAPIVEIPEEEIIQRQIQEARQYLNITDWYYARKAETGEDVPDEVVAKRQEAREFIRNNE